MIEAIIRLKEGKILADAAAEALAVLGAGGNPEASQVEEFLGYCNTPVQNRYTRVLCSEAYAQALELIQSGETCDLVKVLWAGEEEPVLDLPEGERLGRFA